MYAYMYMCIHMHRIHTCIYIHIKHVFERRNCQFTKLSYVASDKVGYNSKILFPKA